MGLKHNHRITFRRRAGASFWGLVMLALLILSAGFPVAQAYQVAPADPTPPGQTPPATATTTLPDGSSVKEITLAGEDKLPDLYLSGLYDRQEMFINLPSNWVLAADSYIEVKLSHSPLLYPPTSNLTLLVNNTPVSSLRLDSSNQTNAIWKVALPAGTQPQQGKLQLGFAASLHTNDLLCPPGDDPGNWLVISSASKLRLAYNQLPPGNLSELTDALFSSQALADRNFALVLPANPTARDLERASQLLVRLGKLAGFNGLNVSLEFGNLPANPSGKLNQIIIGDKSIFPLLSGLKLPVPVANDTFTLQDRTVDPEAGVIQLATPGQPNSGQTLVISGVSSEAVDRAVQSFLDDSSVELMKGTYAVIQPGSQYVPPANPKGLAAIVTNGRTSFARLGQDNQTVSGAGTQTVNVYFTISSNETLTGDAKLYLDYSFSGIADARRSSLTVLVNDIAVQAVPLSNASANSRIVSGPAAPASGALTVTRLEMNIPKDLLQSGDNRLALRFGMFLARDINTSPCGEPATFNNIFGTVYRSSEIELKSQVVAATEVSLSQLPAPFAGLASTTLVVVPDNFSKADYRTGAQMVAELGRNDRSSEVNRIVLLPASQVDKAQLADKNVVLIGTPDNNSLLKEVNSKLPVVWNSNTARTLSTQRGLQLNLNNAGLTGLVQVMASPWNNQRSLLAIIADPSRATDNDPLIPAIARRLFVNRYTGNVIILDSAGKTTTLNTLDKVKAPAVAATAATSPGATPVATTSNTLDKGKEPAVAATSAASPGATPVAPTTGTSGAIAEPAKSTALPDNTMLVGVGTLIVLSLILVVIILIIRRIRKKSKGS